MTERPLITTLTDHELREMYYGHSNTPLGIEIARVAFNEIKRRESEGEEA